MFGRLLRVTSLILLLTQAACFRGAGLFAAVAATAVITAVIVSAEAPPPPQVVVAPPQRAGYEWQPGYWTRQDNRWVWVNGYWVAQAPGYTFVPSHWEQMPDGSWQLVQAGWVPQ